MGYLTTKEIYMTRKKPSKALDKELKSLMAKMNKVSKQLFDKLNRILTNNRYFNDFKQLVEPAGGDLFLRATDKFPDWLLEKLHLDKLDERYFSEYYIEIFEGRTLCDILIRFKNYNNPLPIFKAKRSKSGLQNINEFDFKFIFTPDPNSWLLKYMTQLLESRNACQAIVTPPRNPGDEI
jgi:hypothetical protein